MGFGIIVSRYDVGKCPHCGKPIKGTMQDYEYSGGRVWKEYLEKIGYYVPYEIREKEPERDFYGKDMMLTSEQTKDLATFARKTRTIQLGKHCGAGRLRNRKRRFCSYRVVIDADW